MFNFFSDNRDHRALHFDTSLDDLGLHSRSQMQIRNFCAHFLSYFSIGLNKIQFAVTTYLFIEAYAKCVLHDLYSRERTLLM